METIYISNIDAVGRRGHVRGLVARKILALFARSLLYHATAGHSIDGFILPAYPGEAFLTYLREAFGPLPPIHIAPIDADNLWIADHIAADWVRGKQVDSFISDPALTNTVSAAGGQMLNENAPTVICAVNHKGHFKDLFRGLVKIVPGQAARGTKAIAALVSKAAPCFLRMALAGGDVGNLIFRDPISAVEIEACLAASHSLWAEADGLIEPILPITWSPGVTFDVETKRVLYTFLQITRRGCEYTGCWLPLPPEIIAADQLTELGLKAVERLAQVGFRGEADMDLGLTSTGDLYGFEINGRKDGVRHVWQAVSRWHGPTFDQWRCAVKALDSFQLRLPTLDTQAILRALRDQNLLARPSEPFGVILSIPPSDGVIGVIVIGHDHRDAHQRFLQVNALLGCDENLKEDRPLFPLGAGEEMFESHPFVPAV